MPLLHAQDSRAIPEAMRLLDEAEPIVIPTDTVYGLAADALEERAVLRVFEAKERPPGEPVSVLVGSMEDVRHVARWTPLGRRLAERFMPGPVTIVLPALGTVPDALLGGGRTLGVRVPNAPFARALAAAFGPITATSANLHGKPAARSAPDAVAQFGARVPLYVDGGELPGVASTVIDATGSVPRVVREGAVRAADIEALGASP
ncbi:MAG: L-threonylcarbamoyladenylate synthase [Thermoplasmatota archaeon]